MNEQTTTQDVQNANGNGQGNNAIQTQQPAKKPSKPGAWWKYAIATAAGAAVAGTAVYLIKD